MKKIKIILAGTPQFAVPIFEEVIKNFKVVGIVSQPDRPANRGYKLEATPTKLLAQKYQIPLFQPEKIGQIKEELISLDANFLISAAFGQYIPQSVLNIPKVAAINVHGSLLPKYRGAAPIQHSLLNGDKQTGISLIYMVKEMDAGDILATATLPVIESDTSKELFEKLSILASQNISQWINDLYQNKLLPQKQDQNLVTLSPKIDKSFAELFLSDHKEMALRKIKALNDNPGAFIVLNGKRLKVYRATLKPLKNGLKLDFVDGSLYCYEYQYEGKKKVFINHG